MVLSAFQVILEGFWWKTSRLGWLAGWSRSEWHVRTDIKERKLIINTIPYIFCSIEIIHHNSPKNIRNALKTNFRPKIQKKKNSSICNLFTNSRSTSYAVIWTYTIILYFSEKKVQQNLFYSSKLSQRNNQCLNNTQQKFMCWKKISKWKNNSQNKTKHKFKI